MFKFEHVPDKYEGFDDTIRPKVEFSLSDEASLTCMLEAFENFLRATGYSLTNDSRIYLIEENKGKYKINSDFIEEIKINKGE